MHLKKEDIGCMQRLGKNMKGKHIVFCTYLKVKMKMVDSWRLKFKRENLTKLTNTGKNMKKCIWMWESSLFQNIEIKVYAQFPTQSDYNKKLSICLTLRVILRIKKTDKIHKQN